MGFEMGDISFDQMNSMSGDEGRSAFVRSFVQSQMSRFPKYANVGRLTAKERNARMNWMKEWTKDANRAYDTQQANTKKMIQDELAKQAPPVQQAAPEKMQAPTQGVSLAQSTMQPIQPLQPPSVQSFGGGNQPVPMWGQGNQGGGGGGFLSDLMGLLNKYQSPQVQGQGLAGDAATRYLQQAQVNSAQGTSTVQPQQTPQVPVPQGQDGYDVNGILSQLQQLAQRYTGVTRGVM